MTPKKKGKVRRVVLGEGYLFTDKMPGDKSWKRTVGIVNEHGACKRLNIADRYDGTNDKPYPKCRLIAEIVE